MNNGKTKQKIIHEVQQYAMLTGLLTIFFCAFTIYRRLSFGETAITYFYFGYSVIESMILAKILLLGKYLKLGQRFQNQPLIVPTLYKAFIFCLFVLIFQIAEHFVVGLFSGKTLAIVYSEFYSRFVSDHLGRLPIYFVTFALLFALAEIGSVIGENKMLDLFFKSKGSIPP